MVRETFGQAVDDALAQLEYAGVPRDAVAVIRRRLRKDKRVVAMAIEVVAARDYAVEAVPVHLAAAIERQRAAIMAKGAPSEVES